MFYSTSGKLYGTQPIDYVDPINKLFRWRSAVTNKYYISSIPGDPIRIDAGNSLLPSGFLFNDRPYYTDGTYYLWSKVPYSREWWITQRLGYRDVAGYPCWRRYDYQGMLGSYQSMMGNDDDPKIVTSGSVVGWERADDTPGIYTPVAGSGLTGNKYFGFRVFDYGDGHFTEQMEKTDSNSGTSSAYLGCPTFRDSSGERYLWWSYIDGSGYWIIANTIAPPNPLTGYWRKSASTFETTPAGAYTRIFTGEGDPPTPDTYTLSEQTYDSTEQYGEVFLSQVAIWL